jgi:hypothetical protein
MFVRAPLPWYGPEKTSGSTDETACFLSMRVDELITAHLDAHAMQLSPAYQAALAALPANFTVATAQDFEDFFDDFGTHWTDMCVFGGKLVVSSLTEKREGITNSEIKRSLGIGIQELFSIGGETKWDESAKKVMRNKRDRISAEGGNNALMPSTSKDLSRALYQSWVDSVRVQPAIVRYRVISIADLVLGNAAKKRAIKEAIKARLGAAFEAWQLEQEQGDEHLRGLEKKTCPNGYGS